MMSEHLAGLYQQAALEPYICSDVGFFRATGGFVGTSSANYWERVGIVGDYDYVEVWRDMITTDLVAISLLEHRLHLLDVSMPGYPERVRGCARVAWVPGGPRLRVRAAARRDSGSTMTTSLLTVDASTSSHPKIRGRSCRRPAWSRLRLGQARRRLASLGSGTRTVLVNHYPLTVKPMARFRELYLALWSAPA